ncbi:GOLD domain-containing protein [Rozella allomycis CSF55]|uniref:GOLD domain-containing protein n=1 Tax=Rozella allomycis (strain CSF55) TaxID=988480 RepID=A0A075B2G2_ROZAC|nr:GOLD domain-containing protein [Rozella allomycis CSF55]|eukprot:EPZ35003.1 GOLD domain-containing protein [Rozella allomycis CSF55]
MKASTVIFSLFLASLNALHFYLDGNEQKCFLEELPKDMMVVGNYKTWVFDPKSNGYTEGHDNSLLIKVIVEATGHRLLDQTGSNKGRFVFTASDTATHLVCLKMSNGGSYFSAVKSKVELEFFLGEHGAELSLNDNDDVNKKLTGLPSLVRELNEKITEIRREQMFQKEREIEFRDRSEVVNSHTVTYTIIQIIVLGATCLYQMRYLKRFFQAKKLV